MEAVLTPEIQLNELMYSLTDELYHFVSSVQRPHWRDSAWAEAARQRCRELMERVTEARALAGTAREAMHVRMANAREAAVARREALGESLDHMARSLRAIATELAQRPPRNRWRELTTRLSANYEEMLANLGWLRRHESTREFRVRHLKPVNYFRNVFHVSMGLLAVLMYEFLLTRGQAIIVLASLAGIAVTLESTRRFLSGWNSVLLNLPVFKQVARPGERHKVNGATWYVLSLTAMALLAPMTAVEIGVLILAFGDPAASLVGKLWGHRKLYREKSLLGTLAFAGAAFLAVTAFLALRGWPGGLTVALVATPLAVVAGAAVELFSETLDDNFTILAVSGGIVALFLV